MERARAPDQERTGPLGGMGPLELDRAPDEQPIGPLEQPGPLIKRKLAPLKTMGSPGARWGPVPIANYPLDQAGPLRTPRASSGS